MKDLWARKEAFVRYDGNLIVITAPFNRDYLNELKSGTVSRRWNPDKNVWTASISERTKVLEITRQHFDVIEENPPSGAQSVAVAPEGPVSDARPLEIQEGDKVEIWTDGACVVNPGPGGYAVFFRHNGHIRELAGGYALTTNNRMEITAAIFALESLKTKCKVTLYSDSRYLVNALMLGWAKRWQVKNWKRNSNENAINPDLWQRLLSACTKHDVEFRWVKGHASNTENERCNELAEATARKTDLPADKGYENGVK